MLAAGMMLRKYVKKKNMKLGDRVIHKSGEQQGTVCGFTGDVVSVRLDEPYEVNRGISKFVVDVFVAHKDNLTVL